MDSQESESVRWNVEVSLPCDTPVVGCKLTPLVKVTGQGSTKLPRYSFCFSWYSLQFSCSILELNLATHQYQECVQLGEPVESCQFSSEHASLHRFQSENERNGECTLVARQKVWVKVGSSITYEPSLDNFGCTLKLETVAIDCSNGTPLSPTNTIITQPVTFFPAHHPRHIIQIGNLPDPGNANLVDQSSDDISFSVLSYNILANIYMYTEKYHYCPKWALIWENRRENLLDEIIGYNADVICLQEAQCDHLESFFMPRLVELGYSVVYENKKHPTVFTGNQYVGDCCAIFYRTKLFKPIGRDKLAFKDEAQSVVKALVPEQDDTGKSRLTKDNVAVLVLFGILKNNSQSAFCVANTHICAQRYLPDVKLLQITKLLHKLEETVDPKVPIIICGDLNVLPGSDAHTLLVRGQIDSPREAGSDPYKVYQFLKLKHSLNLKSAYAAVFDAANTNEIERQLSKMDWDNSEPLFTYGKPRSSKTVDYIFYTANNLRVDGLLELLDSEALLKGMPSPEWPSDHLALMARFRFK